MAQVTVNIAGRPFRMACNDGEEPHIEALAQQVEAKIADLRTAFGEIGDHRLTVMAAIFFADELSDVKQRMAKLEAEMAAIKAAQTDTGESNAALTQALASALETAAVRIEGVAKGMR